jgi:ectoine hydroxylase-related dioxygenase (phytanoyl-CoA dioxygenase family)
MSHQVQSSQALDTTVPASYANEGYVIAKGAFSADLLEDLKLSLRSVLEKNDRHRDENSQRHALEELILMREREAHSLVYNASQSVGSSAAGYVLLGKSGILESVARASGFHLRNLHLTPMYLIVQLPNDERFDYVWHQDRAYYPWAQDMVTLWFPVNRATTRYSGTISVIPGSHRSGLRAANTTFRDGFFRQIESPTDTGEANDEVFMELDAGDCCIMHGDTVHRSVSNRADSPRVAAVVRIVNISDLPSYERERFYCVHKS